MPEYSEPNAGDFLPAIEWKSEQRLTCENFVELLPFALENDRADFIREFVEREDVVWAFLDAEQLSLLYQKVF